MPPKMTHAQCCDIVCLICGNESGSRGNRKISQAEVPIIKEHVLPGYDPQDDRLVKKIGIIWYLFIGYRFPRATCTTCRHRLKFPHTLVLTTLYTSNMRRQQTRAEAACREEDCLCCVCKRARLSGGAWNAFKKEMRQTGNQNKENNKPGMLRLCPDCFHPISQGCRHTCGVEAELSNISKRLGSEKMRKLCHSYIKGKVSTTGNSMVTLESSMGGKPMKVAINPKDEKPKKVFGLKQTLALRTEGNFTSK